MDLAPLAVRKEQSGLSTLVRNKVDLVPLAVRKEQSGLMILPVRKEQSELSTLGCTYGTKWTDNLACT